MSLLSEPGDISQVPLAAILLEALNVRASGVLEVEHGGGASKLWFQDGRPVGAQVFTGFKPLGMMLLQAGLIDFDVLSTSLARMAETQRPQGEILVEMGAVSAEDVGEMLAKQQASYFDAIAALDKGRFSFDAAAKVPQWTAGSRLSPVRTIVDALTRPQASALVSAALKPAEASGLRLSSGYAEFAGRFRWTPEEHALIARVEELITLEGALAPSKVPQERARAIFAGLLLLGVAVAGPKAEVTEGIALTADDLTRAHALGGATRDTPARAAEPVPAAPPPTPQRRSDPAEARARRQRLLQQAMKNMGIGPFAERGGGAPAPPASTPAPQAPTPTPAAPPSITEADLRKGLLDIAPRAQERDLFVRLGLPETAGREEVKKAFLSLAKRFHPDRFASAALADLQEVVRDFFAAVNEAYETLSDDKKRLEYLNNRKGGEKERSLAAKVDYEKGEACLRTRDFGRARGFLESAVRADPRPLYQATLAHAYIADPVQKDRSRAKELIAEAIKDPSCDRALFLAGVVARDEGDLAAAERHLRAAVKVNPRSADAVRELRYIEGRRADKRR